MRTWWIVCLLLAACGADPAGLTLVVVTPAAAGHLEMFVAIDDCKLGTSGCPGIVPPMFKRRKVGDGFFLDDRLAARFEVTGTETIVRLTSDTTLDHTAKRIVVVAFDEQDQPIGSFVARDAMIPASDAVAWKIRLDPWQPPVDQQQPKPADGNHVLLWNRKGDGLASCVLVEHVDGGASSYAFLVPRDDTDCDSVVLECDAFWYEKPVAMTSPVNRASCLAPAPMGGACRLAGPACDEAAATASGCIPSDVVYCFPDQACADVSGCPGDGKFGACAATLSSPLSLMPFVSVGWQRSATDGPCTNSGLDHVTVDAAGLVAAAGGTMACDDVKLRDMSPASPGMPISFNQVAQVTFGAAAGSVGIKASLSGPPCMVDLAWVTGIAGDQPDKPLWLDLKAGNGHVVVPLYVRFEVPSGARCVNSISPMVNTPTNVTAPFHGCLTSPP